MKYWVLKSSVEGLTVSADIKEDYINQTVFADATDNEGDIEGSLDDDYPFFSGAKEKIFSQRLVNEILKFNPEGVTIKAVTLKLPDGTLNKNWSKVVVSAHVDCIDFSESRLKLRNSGTIRSLKKLVLDTDKADRAGYDIFRLHHRFTSVIVSDRLKQAIESVNPIGIQFYPTDGSE